MEAYKQGLAKLFGNIGFQLSPQRTKYDEDRQGIFEFSYTSRIDWSPQTIKVDIKIVPGLLKPHVNKHITAIYQDPISEQLFFGEHSINVMDIDEIFAEKMRAALTRIEPAIRDFFDIWYTKQKWFDFEKIKGLIHQKVAEEEYKYSIDGMYDQLYKQIVTELEPVLKNGSNYDFDLHEIYNFVLSFRS